MSEGELRLNKEVTPEHVHCLKYLPNIIKYNIKCFLMFDQFSDYILIPSNFYCHFIALRHTHPNILRV